jgi:hypothetical protein
VGQRQNVEAARTTVASPVSSNANASGLQASIADPAPTGGITFTFYVGAAATALTCTVPAGSDACSFTATVPLTSGDRVSVLVSKAAAAGAVRGLSWSVALS